MAVPTAFKLPCPSCEAMVPIKENQVGKKVECPTCKDKFVAEKPAEKKKTTLGKKTTSLQKKEASTTSKVSAPAKKTTKLKVQEEVEDLDELEDEDEVQAKPGKGKAKKADTDEDEDAAASEEQADEKPKKAKAGSNKLMLGLLLAVVGVVALCVAAYLILSRPPRPGPPPILPINKDPLAEEQKPIDPKEGKKVKKSTDSNVPEWRAGALTDAEVARLTNLLPNDTEHVFHGFFKEVFATSNPLRDAVFLTPGALDDAELKKKIGFSVQAIDDMIIAERYSQPWSFTVIRFKDVINEADLKTTLKLRVVGSIQSQLYYQTSEVNPWLEQLARFSIGLPSHARTFYGRVYGRTSYLRLHNPQTLIIADEVPMKAFLLSKGQPKLLTERPRAGASLKHQPPEGGYMFVSALVQETQLPGSGDAFTDSTEWEGELKTADKTRKIKLQITRANKATLQNDDSGEAEGTWQRSGNKVKLEFSGQVFEGLVKGKTMSGDVVAEGTKLGSWSLTLIGSKKAEPMPMPNPGASARDEMYLTIKPSLKELLDKMESRGPDNTDKPFFSSATDMDAGRVKTELPEEFRHRIIRRPRQFWDMTLLLTETNPKSIRFLGTGLVQRETTAKYQYRNELVCDGDDAKTIGDKLQLEGFPAMAQFIFKLTGQEVRYPQPKKEPPKGVELPAEEKKPLDVAGSQLTLNQQGERIEVTLDLLLNTASMKQVVDIAALTASVLRVDMDMAASLSWRHQLAAAGKALGENGLSQRGIPPRQYPPGAFPPPDGANFVGREPRNRIGWMASLLPYMGHKNLFDRIKFEQSWRDPGNWMAGRTIVPQFIDPTYPEHTRLVSVGNLPVEFGATHYVGIAGVGRNAATYKRGNPATLHKQGVFSYDGSASVDEVRDGRGLSNTVLMAQVPPDSLTGVHPWIAGGGAALRGVPDDKDTRAIAPFLLSDKWSGQNKKGTYVLLADGTVRFIDEMISDDVFKAMCTIKGPAPKKFDIDNDPAITLIPEPKKREVKKPAEAPKDEGK